MLCVPPVTGHIDKSQSTFPSAHAEKASAVLNAVPETMASSNVVAHVDIRYTLDNGTYE